MVHGYTCAVKYKAKKLHFSIQKSFDYDFIFSWISPSLPLSLLQEIHPNSPAAQAGLIPHTDYILGSEMMTSGDDDLYSLIESHNHQEVKLYVYNSETDACREVSYIDGKEFAR